MIRVLGKKRITLLAILILANVAAVFGVYAYMTPEITKQERSLRSLRGKITTLQQDIGRLELEFKQLELQQAEFERLKEQGFMSNQGRRQAELLLKEIQQQAGVVSAVASIKAGELEENEEAAKAEYVILKSPVEIKLEAMDDIDVYKYIYMVEQFFPGHISVDDITLKRRLDVSGPLLRSIATGGNPILVEADITMSWRTMIPKSEIIEPEGGRL